MDHPPNVDTHFDQNDHSNSVSLRIKLNDH